jgi:predicted nucleic acid-binding protein
MSGNKALLDSNVIIFASKSLIDVDKLLQKYDEFCVSIITYMEVYGYEFDNLEEKELIDELFGIIEIIDVDRTIADYTIGYRKNKTKKIKLPDAIILATAKYLEADLISDDWDDFQGFDENVNILNIDDLKNSI